MMTDQGQKHPFQSNVACLIYLYYNNPSEPLTMLKNLSLWWFIEENVIVCGESTHVTLVSLLNSLHFQLG